MPHRRKTSLTAWKMSGCTVRAKPREKQQSLIYSIKLAHFTTGNDVIQHWTADPRTVS